MKSLIDPAKLLAIARISGYDRDKNTFLFTYGGDALKSLKVPFAAFILILDKKPISSSDVLVPSARGLEKVEGHYVPVIVNSFSIIKNKGRFKLQSTEQIETENTENTEDIKGSWLCIEKSILENTPGIYLFQFMGALIYEKEGDEPVATVKDYFDNGSHGILVTVTIDGNEVLIPFVDQYVTFIKEKKIMYIPDFNLFVIS